jgi:hypothetical protein
VKKLFNNPQEDLHIHGFIEIKLFDPTGELKDYRLIPNLITTKGFNKYLQAVFNNETVAHGTFLCIGTTATGLSAANTALEAQVDIQSGTYSHTADTAQGTVAYTWQAGATIGPWAIVEMGLKDAAAGTLICRGTFAAVNKGTADTFEGRYIHSLS